MPCNTPQLDNDDEKWMSRVLCDLCKKLIEIDREDLMSNRMKAWHEIHKIEDVFNNNIKDSTHEEYEFMRKTMNRLRHLYDIEFGYSEL